ncbi:MAG: hypothetical protein SFY67_09980 [Candidatus Melainabacteria bacterium]|nr:hypothetical protein [Candidatus Melainabacteria bacterium]
MKKKSSKKLASSLIHAHFPGLEIEELYTAQRKFPSTLRADLQLALEDIFKNQYQGKLVGLFRSYPVGGLSACFLQVAHSMSNCLVDRLAELQINLISNLRYRQNFA